MKNIKVSTISTTILLMILLTQNMYADGMIYKFDEKGDFRLSSEESQFCFINYEWGIEHLLLNVDSSDIRGSDALWIFPVPASPRETEIDILKGFPELHGPDIKETAERNIATAVTLMQASQVYTIPPLLIYSTGTYMGQHSLTTGINTDYSSEGVTLFQHVERSGVSSELITAETADGIYGYLSGKGLEMPAESKDIINQYIGEEYSFVVSWISDPDEFENETQNMRGYREYSRSIGTYVKFPTDRLYFPLKPTSVYGSQEIPIAIYVTGHVSPSIYGGIKRETEIEYRTDEFYRVPQELSKVFNGRTELTNLKYTKILIDTPSKYLTDDLWMDDREPAGVLIAKYVNEDPWIWGISYFTLCSCLASLIAGLIVFRNQRINKPKFFLYGLWNFLTLIGFSIAVIFLKTRELSTDLEKELKSQKLRVFDMRKIPYIFLYSIVFLALTIILQVALVSLIKSL